MSQNNPLKFFLNSIPIFLKFSYFYPIRIEYKEGL